MSETDSDLDFESADEETESESHANSATSEKVEKKSLSENQTEDTKVHTLTTSTAKENVSESNVGNTPSQESVQYEQKKELVTKPVEGSEIGSQQDKQRVTLRLEKKLKQKNQISEENSVEKPIITNSADSQNVDGGGKSSSWGFSSWGTNLLSTAASSVSTFTNQVSQGIGTVIETVENTLGAPPPEELAGAINRKQSEDSSEGAEVSPSDESKATDAIAGVDKSAESRSGLLPDVSSWTKLLENTGSKVIMGGLDTLELIGKKTIDILTEGDPGLRKKRSVFHDGITLSQILREAKEKADELSEKNSEGKDAIHYSQLFDEFQGLVHLEALEMLSKQSHGKVQRLLSRIPKDSEVKRNLDEIKAICESLPSLDDSSDCEKFEDFEAVFKKHALELNLPFNVDSVIKTQTRINQIVMKYEGSVENNAPEEIYQSAICNLAEFTAKCIETFHKLAELILVQSTLDPPAVQCATHLTGLTTVMCVEINNLSSRYHSCLDSLSTQSKDDADPVGSNVTIIVTNLYLEAASSNTYIQDAYQLLVPVLQVSLLEASD